MSQLTASLISFFIIIHRTHTVERCCLSLMREGHSCVFDSTKTLQKYSNLFFGTSLNIHGLNLLSEGYWRYVMQSVKLKHWMSCDRTWAFIWFVLTRGLPCITASSLLRHLSGNQRNSKKKSLAVDAVVSHVKVIAEYRFSHCVFVLCLSGGFTIHCAFELPVCYRSLLRK